MTTKPYLSYRIYPECNGTGNRVIGYSVSLWHPVDGDMDWIGSACMGSDDWDTRYGEYTLADAKRAAQQHHNTHNT